MTGIQLALALGILPLLILAVLVTAGRALQPRVLSKARWPVDVYVEERRRWVRSLNNRPTRTWRAPGRAA